MMMSDFIGAIEFMDPWTPIEKLCQEKKIMEVSTLHLRAIMSASRFWKWPILHRKLLLQVVLIEAKFGGQNRVTQRKLG